MVTLQILPISYYRPLCGSLSPDSSSCDELAAPPSICPLPPAPCLKIRPPRRHRPPDQAAPAPPVLDPAAALPASAPHLSASAPARGDAKPSCSSIDSHRGASRAPSLPLLPSPSHPLSLFSCRYPPWPSWTAAMRQELATEVPRAPYAPNLAGNRTRPSPRAQIRCSNLEVRRRHLGRFN